MMGDNYFSLQVKNGIPYKEESVKYLRVLCPHAVQVYKKLTLEEARIERFMTGKNKGQHSLLAHFPQGKDFQQKQPSLPVTLHTISQQQHQLDIQKQP